MWPRIWTQNNQEQIQQVARVGLKPGTTGLWVRRADHMATPPPYPGWLHYFQMKSSFKMESIRKLSNFNFQWTKTLHQKNFKHIASFFTLFKGYSCNKLYEITPKKRFLWEPEKKKLQKLQISQHEIFNCMMILPVFSQSCEIWNLFSQSPPIRNIVFVLLQITNYTYSPQKV